MPNANQNQQDNALYREAPINEEAEQGLLGAILIDNAALDKVGEMLRADHFAIPVHGRIYEAIIKLRDQGQVATPVTLKAYFSRDEDLAGVGGAGYLAQLAAHASSIYNAADYANTIYECYIRRSLITIGENIVNSAYDYDFDSSSENQIEEAENELFQLGEMGNVERHVVSLRDAVRESIDMASQAFQRSSKVTGVTSGLRDFDDRTGGLQRSDLLILAGRPAMGKTALATNIAFNAARAYADSNGEEGAKVVFFSLEMSAPQLATRILADLAEVTSDKIRRGDVAGEDFDKFVDASQKMANIPLYIDDTINMSISGLRTRARRLKRTHGIGMIVIDYLQLLAGSSKRGSENRVQEISEISRGLKAIAKDLQVPVLALAQLSRRVEERDDKRPQLSDLRESGSIEQDADVVMFVYREEYYIGEKPPVKTDRENTDKYNERVEDWKQRCSEVQNLAELIVAKQRHGPVGTVLLHFDGRYTRFSDYTDRVEI